MKQSWTCAVDQNRPLCAILPVFEMAPLNFVILARIVNTCMTFMFAILIAEFITIFVQPYVHSFT